MAKIKNTEGTKVPSDELIQDKTKLDESNIDGTTVSESTIAEPVKTEEPIEVDTSILLKHNTIKQSANLPVYVNATTDELDQSDTIQLIEGQVKLDMFKNRNLIAYLKKQGFVDITPPKLGKTFEIKKTIEWIFQAPNTNDERLTSGNLGILLDGESITIPYKDNKIVVTDERIANYLLSIKLECLFRKYE